MNDKTKHALVGFAIAFVFTAILAFFINPSYALLIGWGIAGLAGVVKDVVWDKWLGKGTFELLDIWVTILGGFAGSWVSLLIYEIIF